jgi:flavin-dependent dehydrogenase
MLAPIMACHYSLPGLISHGRMLGIKQPGRGSGGEGVGEGVGGWLEKRGVFAYNYGTVFDVIVIGGGHAGSEAAHAAVRLGCETLLLTQDPARIVAQSCNPAVGGVGKGHIVREIVALGGLMGRVTDASGIHFRTLNTRKGPAVRATRVQTDSARYSLEMQKLLCATEGLTIGTGEVVRILVVHGGLNQRVLGVELSDGSEIKAKSVVLATGTFLGGRVGRRAPISCTYGLPQRAWLRNRAPKDRDLRKS